MVFPFQILTSQTCKQLPVAAAVAVVLVAVTLRLSVLVVPVAAVALLVPAAVLVPRTLGLPVTGAR